ncbi:uncharacterized protein JCM6883_001386 [Sporobolomyces salmoneus]|uniref:uncharacterized protein n=1 Tax=Sporobolomyces salmoneus TaxID=183962 RepID=UPI003172F5EC
MDRLPFELLEYIADCLSLEPDSQLRQSSFSYLSRTNKTLQLAAQPILYRDPVLLSDWRAKLYEKTLGNKVDPWLLSRSSKLVKQWWMPRSLKFDFPEPPPECSAPSWHRVQTLDQEFYYPSARPIPLFLSCRHDFVWSNLTSFETSPHALDTNFSSHLFGPGKKARQVVTSLTLGEVPCDYFPFLFDAIHFTEAGRFVCDWVKFGVDWPSDDSEEELKEWERREGGQHDENVWDWGIPSRQTIQKARFDYDVWQVYVAETMFYDVDFNPGLIHSRRPSSFPFSSLTNLAITCNTPLDYLLLFYTSSFPRLETLSLFSDSEFGPGDGMEWATLRFSITREKGVGINYAADNNDASILKPLSENEMLEYPLKPYRGPNLRRLELSLTWERGSDG